MYIQTYAQQTCIHRCVGIHQHTHMNTHVCQQRHKYMSTHADAHACINTYTYTHIYTYTDTGTHLYIYLHNIHTHSYMYVQTHKHTYLHTFIHTCKHTHIHNIILFYMRTRLYISGVPMSLIYVQTRSVLKPTAYLMEKHILSYQENFKIIIGRFHFCF